MRFIGDVHGKMAEYMFITDGCKESIQVGDFGAGFVQLFDMSPNHRFIRGNHDSPDVCREHPNWIPDLTVENDIMFLGGAWSIDHEHRVPGVSWWYDEELSWSSLYDGIEIYNRVKPRVMVTHDGPDDVMKSFFPYKDRSSRTSEALQAMFDSYQPEFWLQGHWHESVDKIVNGTRFIVLPELGYIDIDITNI